MAVSGNPHDDPLARDPRLARLMQAAGDEMPPPALDAAILAAARREVSARPQVLDGGGEAAVPPLRARRNWYVPVSIAAVLVLSVSLVTLVHEEKGDELARPSDASAPPAAAPAPQPSQEAASAPAAPAAESAADNVVAKSKDSASQTLPKLAEADASRKQAPPQPREDEAPAKTAKAAVKAEPAPAERTQATEDRNAPAVAVARPDNPTSPATAASPSISAAPANALPPPAAPAPSVAAAGAAAPVAPSSPTAPSRFRERRPDPFPSAGERDGPVASAREPARRLEMEEAAPNYSAVPQAAPAVPPPRAAMAPRSVPAPEQAPRAMAPPPPAAQRPSSEPAPPAAVEDRTLKRGAMQAPARPAWLIELDRQPPEKWLERLAEFKRDGRNGDAEVLLIEFRRRFPDHPASAR